MCPNALQKARPVMALLLGMQSLHAIANAIYYTSRALAAV